MTDDNISELIYRPDGKMHSAAFTLFGGRVSKQPIKRCGCCGEIASISITDDGLAEIRCIACKSGISWRVAKLSDIRGLAVIWESMGDAEPASGDGPRPGMFDSILLADGK